MLSQLSYASETSLITIPYPAGNCKRFFRVIRNFFAKNFYVPDGRPRGADRGFYSKKAKIALFPGEAGGIFPKIRGGFTKNNTIRARRTAMIF